MQPVITYSRNPDGTYPLLEAFPDVIIDSERLPKEKCFPDSLHTIPEPIRIFPDDPDQDQPLHEPSIPYGYEDTKDWSWR